MDYSTRNELLSSLKNDATFASFTCNVDRVSYVLKQYINAEFIHRQVKENFVNVTKKVAKCGIKANCYTEEAKLQMIAKDGTASLAALRKALLYAPPEMTIGKIILYLKMFSVNFKLMAKYEAALWAIEQVLELTEKHKIPTSKTPILYLKAAVLKKLHRSEEAAKIVQNLLKSASDDDADSSTMSIAKKLQPKNLKKFLEMLKKDVETPSYSADLKQWRESQISSSTAFKNIVSRGSTTAAYRINEQQVRIENSPNIGRHFVAISCIPSGTVILEERPISLAVQPTVLGIKCTACYHDLEHRYLPCSQCTTAVYCNSSCARADAMVHSTACGGMMQLLYEKVGTFAMHLLIMITRVGGPEKAMQIQTELAKKSYSIDQYMEEKEKAVSDEDKSVIDYKMACILASNEEKQQLESHIKYTVMALETAVALIHVSENSSSNFLQTDFLVSFAAQLTTNLRQLSYNVFGWTDWSLDLYVGNCQALVGSLVNHSCVANTKWEWKDGVISFTTRREVAIGEHITISYGTNDCQSYDTRQERLNHYLFGCACAACLKDAAAGSALKCTNCSLGPVVYDSPLNKVPSISGKCLQCFALHPTFDESTASLKETIGIAKTLLGVNACLSILDTGKMKLLQLCEKLLSSLHQLALPSGKAIMKSTLAVTSVLLLNCTVALEQLNIDHRIHIVDIIDQCLPTVFPTELIDSAMMRTIFGWFNLVLKWAEEFNLTAHYQSTAYEPRDCLHLVLRFHSRCQEALKSMVVKEKEDGDLEVFSAIVDKQLHQLDMKLDKYREKF